MGDNIHRSKQEILVVCGKCYVRGSTGHNLSVKKATQHSFGKLGNAIYNTYYLNCNLRHKKERDDSVKSICNFNTLLCIAKCLPERSHHLNHYRECVRQFSHGINNINTCANLEMKMICVALI